MTSELLRELGIRLGCDKFNYHDYSKPYSDFFDSIRTQSLTILEIGIGGENIRLGGESLLVWSTYFPNSKIHGIDIYDKTELEQKSPNIFTHICDQGNPSQLVELGKNYGPFDIIIDDGSHICTDVITSSKCLFPFLKANGIYIIEDIQTSYWEKYGGSSMYPGFLRYTTIDYLKGLVDVVNTAENPRFASDVVSNHISSIIFYPNIVFIRKAELEHKSAVYSRNQLSNMYRDECNSSNLTSEIISELDAIRYSPQMNLFTIDLFAYFLQRKQLIIFLMKLEIVARELIKHTKKLISWAYRHIRVTSINHHKES